MRVVKRVKRVGQGGRSRHTTRRTPRPLIGTRSACHELERLVVPERSTESPEAPQSEISRPRPHTSAVQRKTPSYELGRRTRPTFGSAPMLVVGLFGTHRWKEGLFASDTTALCGQEVPRMSREPLWGLETVSLGESQTGEMFLLVCLTNMCHSVAVFVDIPITWQDRFLFQYIGCQSGQTKKKEFKKGEKEREEGEIRGFQWPQNTTVFETAGKTCCRRCRDVTL